MNTIFLSVKQVAKIYQDKGKFVKLDVDGENFSFKFVKEKADKLIKNGRTAYNSTYEQFFELEIECQEIGLHYIGDVFTTGDDKDDMEISCGVVFNVK